MDGGEVVRVGQDKVKENGALLADLIAYGIAVQELDDTAVVVREENESEVRDMVHVGGAPNGMVFMTPRKDKGKERAREGSPSPAPRRKGQAQSGLSLATLNEGLEDDEEDDEGIRRDSWAADKKGKGEVPDSVSSWGGVENEEYYIIDSEGNRKGPFRFSQAEEWGLDDTANENAGKLGEFKPGQPGYTWKSREHEHFRIGEDGNTI